MLLGVHCSVAGGVVNAFTEAEKLKIDAFQIFTKNQRQWKEKLIGEEEAGYFKGLYQEKKVSQAVSHATYLINLASVDPTIRENSVKALVGELARCESLGLQGTVLHPGAAKGLSEKEAIQKIAEGLKIILAETEGLVPKILLENTAGQGSSIGWKFEHLKEIIDQTASEKIAVCIDTCHAFAAGYDIRTQSGLEDMLNTVDTHIGLDQLKVLHLNDSKGALGSKIDRHAGIGEGHIGVEPFKIIMQKFQDIPKILETPKDNNGDERNLALLKSLL